MSANRLKASLERFMYNPLQDRVKEAAELKERHEAIQEEINNSDMITISELIGFPVSKEQGEELMNRLSIYNKMTKKELMVLLLQYDWELLQMQTQTQEKITKNVMGEYLAEVGTRIQSAIGATCSAKAIAEMKRFHDDDFVNKACEVLRDLTEDRLGDAFMDDFKRRLEEQ